MDIKERTNLVTISIDLEDPKSVSSAISFIKGESPHCEPSYTIYTDKIRLIKLLRAHADAVSSGDADSGLRSAKNFLERRMGSVSREKLSWDRTSDVSQ